MSSRFALRLAVVGVVAVGLGIGCLVAVRAVLTPPADTRLADTNFPSTPTRDRLRKLPVGAPAPDFTLPALGDGKPVHLADLIGRRPVVLVLGSFRCSYFCHRLDVVRELYTRFKPRAEFLFVYIDNEHRGAEPEWLKEIETDPTADVDEPVNRLPRIRAGMEHYRLDLPCVDDFDAKKALQAYDASPAKLVIIDRDGRIAYDSGVVTNSGLNPSAAADWLEQHTPAADANDPSAGRQIVP